MSNVDKRRSIRKYSLKLIDRDILVNLCKSGFLAANARGQNSRSFIIIDDKNIINKLSEISQGAAILNNALYAICVIGINTSNLASPLMQCCDLQASVDNIMIKALDYNIATCQIGVYPIEERMLKAKEILGLENEDFCYSIISLGYPLSDNEFYIKEDKIKEDQIYFNKVK